MKYSINSAVFDKGPIINLYCITCPLVFYCLLVSIYLLLISTVIDSQYIVVLLV